MLCRAACAGFPVRVATGVRVRGDGEPEVAFRTDGFGPLDVMARTPADSSWPNRVEAPFTALRHFAPDGTDHATHAA